MSSPQIDGYTDVVQVARGGFGIVYRARREHLDQDVALKVLALADLSERDLERFQRECRAAGNLSWHPHVVAVYDSGVTTDGHPYLAMEYLDAGTLADRLTTDGPLPWADVLDAGIQVTGALGAAHAAGTLHRDLKPENILIGPFGEAKLGDFGIAAVEGGSRTATGHASYTVTHVAPEILRGQRPDERSDLYGLGSTLFTLLTGRTPFAGDDPDEPIAAIITRALTEPAPRLAGIPQGLADLLEQTLDKDPDHRPQTADAFGHALQHIQRDSGLPVTTLRLGRTAGATRPTPAADTPQGDNRRTIHVGPTPPVEPVERREPESADPNATITVAPNPKTTPDQPDTAPPPPPPDTSQAPPPPQPPTARPERSKKPLLIGLAIIAVLALAGGALLVLGGDDNAGPSPSSTSSTSTTTSGTTNTVTDTISVTTSVRDDVDTLAATADALWIVNDGEGTITRLEPASAEVDAVIDVDAGVEELTREEGEFFNGIAAVGASVWLSMSLNTVRLDAETNEVDFRLPGSNTTAVAANTAGAWLAADGVTGDAVVRVDATMTQTTQQEQIVIEDSGSSVTDIAATERAVWVTDSSRGQLLRVDPATVTLAETVSVGGSPRAVSATDDAVWVIDAQTRHLIRVDPVSDEVVETIQLDGLPVDLAATERAVWVSLERGQVVRIDPSSNEVTATVEVRDPTSVAATNRDVWVASGSSEVVRIDPG